MTLKSIEEHEARIASFYKKPDRYPTGIACPLCGVELEESSPGVTLMSYPPQKSVHCPECKYATNVHC